jgi:hypothetical protein
VFCATIVARVAYVASTIPRLVGVEMVEPLLSAPRHRTAVTVMRVIAVVDVAVEAAPAVEPGASSKKHPADKPVGAIVAVGRAVVRSIVEVPIGADGRHSNVDGNLGWPQGSTA